MFKLKHNEDGSIERRKARLVVKGCAQKKASISMKPMPLWPD